MTDKQKLEAIKAELEKLQNIYSKDLPKYDRLGYEGKKAILKDLQDFIATLDEQSEDERIRKAILSTIKSQGFISDEETLRQCIAWLEKQKLFKWSETDDNRLSNLFGIIDSADNWNIPSKIAFKDWLQSIKKKLKGE